jgi:hypothetical protein
MHPLSELKYRYLKWKINRVRKKFDVYSGGRANDYDRRGIDNCPGSRCTNASRFLVLAFNFLILRDPRQRRARASIRDRQAVAVGQKAT